MSTSRFRPKTVQLIALTAALTLSLAGCANVGRSGDPGRAAGQAPGSKKGDILTIAQPAPATGINPMSVNTAFWNYAALAYEPLLYRGPDGTLQPALAESWTLEDKNTRFTATVRDNVKFSDGTPVNADAVAASLKQCAAKDSANSATLSDVTSITALDNRRVELRLAKPNPLIDLQLSQTAGCGMIVSPAGLADIKSLTVDKPSAGAGAYIYQPGESVPGDRYTYTANPDYYAPQRQRWNKVVIRVIANPQAVLNALRTKQVDLASGDPSTMQQAESLKVQMAHTPFVWGGINLIDRRGELTKAMGDVRVRQAINLAIDRKAITTALFGKYGLPTSQPVAEGFDGHVPELTDAYPYDPARARALLAEAGYAEGLTIPAATLSMGGMDTMMKAITPMLKEVGITLEVTTSADEKNYIDSLVNRKSSIVSVGYGSQPMFLMGKALVLPTGKPFNGFSTDDPKANELYAAVASAESKDRTAAAQALNRYLVEQAWFAPISFGPVMYYARDGLGGVKVNGGAPTLSFLDLYQQG